MFGDIWPLISVVIGILLLLSLIIFLKLNTFISLIITSVDCYTIRHAIK